MRPEDQQIATSNARGNVQPPQRNTSAAQSAVVSVANAQIDSIYAKQGHSTQPTTAKTTQSEEQLPAAYKRTHTTSHEANADQWRNYHTAWQDYYQKYYEHYYVGAVHQVHKAYTDHTANLQQQQTNPMQTAPASESLSQQEAVDDLRSQLLQKVTSAGRTARKSRHFIPITAALVVLLLFSFLQYNRVIIANVQAYITPGEIDPQSIVVDPNSSLQVSQDPLLIIPKINVNVPVNYNTKSDQASQLKAMLSGVAYFGIPGANSKPGQVGNTVLSGHSSNDFTEAGSYKFVFALLDRLKPGDIFYLHYNGIRYTYSVTKTRVVKPTEVSALVYKTTKPEVTLITCTPLGTALNRLLVTAEQVSPSPTSASAAPTTAGSTKSAEIPGSSPTFVERLFGAS